MTLTLSCQQLIALYVACSEMYGDVNIQLLEHNLHRNFMQHFHKLMMLSDDFSCCENCLECLLHYDLCDDMGNPIPFDGDIPVSFDCYRP